MSKQLTPTEAAVALGCTAKTVRRLVLTGQLPGYKLGRAVRIDEAQLQAWKAAGGTRQVSNGKEATA